MAIQRLMPGYQYRKPIRLPGEFRKVKGTPTGYSEYGKGVWADGFNTLAGYNEMKFLS